MHHTYAPHTHHTHTQTHSHTSHTNSGAVLGVCMCHPTSQDSLKLWLGSLQETYPTLANATVIYNTREPGTKETQTKQLQGGDVATIPDTTAA